MLNKYTDNYRLHGTDYKVSKSFTIEMKQVWNNMRRKFITMAYVDAGKDTAVVTHENLLDALLDLKIIKLR